MTDEKHSGAALTADERIQKLTEQLEEAREERWKATSASFNRNSVRAAGDYLELLCRIAQVEQAYPDLDRTSTVALETIKTVALDALRGIGEQCEW